MKHFLLVATALIAFSAQAAENASQVIAKAKLGAILSCRVSAKPTETVALIKSLGGIGIVQKSPLSDAEYTIPNPVAVFGHSVTKISIHQGENNDGDFNEYGSLLTSEAFEVVAQIAEVRKDAAGLYRKEIGANDLTLRPEAGATYVTCANDVRTIMKTIRRTVKAASQSSK